MHTGSARANSEYYCETKKNRWKSAVTQSHSINELNLRINSKCAAPRHAFIEHAVGHLRLHLRACVRAECGHASEHAVMKIM